VHEISSSTQLGTAEITSIEGGATPTRRAIRSSSGGGASSVEAVIKATGEYMGG